MKLSGDGLDWLKKWNQVSPRSTALIDGDTGIRWSYQQLFLTSQQMATTLSQNYGVRAGDRIAILSLNELEYIALFFATARLGATLVPVNYRLKAKEVSYIISDCQADLLIYHREFQTLIDEVTNNLSTNKEIKTIELKSICSESSNLNLVHDFLSTEDDIAMIIYTSGTTGFPKGAMLSHRMLFWNSINTFLRLDITKNDLAVIFLPLFHTGGWNVLTTPFLHHGSTVVLTKKFDADQILNLSEKHKATLLFGVPTTMDMMARSPEFKNVDLSHIRYAIVGGEPMPLELIETWHKKGLAIRQGYGLTEFGPNVFSLNEEDAIRKIGSIGFANFYIQTRIVNESGQDCPANEIGELWLKGPSQMTGYYGNPKATDETLVDGWLKTGDLVRMDSEGYFYVVGRKKEMYKSGGENVYPAEVEKCIRNFSGIREVAVIGVKDPKWGEVGYAFVSVEQGFKFDESELLSFCSQNLAKFKIPKYIQVLNEIPKGDSGKLLKKSLSQYIQNENLI